MRGKFRLILSTIVFSVFAASSQAILVFNFDTVVTGDTPGGASPWATLTISDAGANTVNFTLTHNATSSSGQFITALWLNMDPFPGNPQIVENSPTILSGQFKQDAFNNAGLDFDGEILFETSNTSGDRLEPAESVSWQITGTGLNESAFNSFSGGNQQVLAMIHVQGIDPGNEGSGKVAAVPEPASLAAIMMGAAVLLRRRRK